MRCAVVKKGCRVSFLLQQWTIQVLSRCWRYIKSVRRLSAPLAGFSGIPYRFQAATGNRCPRLVHRHPDVEPSHTCALLQKTKLVARPKNLSASTLARHHHQTPSLFLDPDSTLICLGVNTRTSSGRDLPILHSIHLATI